MSHLFTRLLPATIALTCGLSSHAFAAETFTDMFKEGEAHINFRLRHEAVDQDGLEDSDATTIRTRLNFKTASLAGFSAFIEMDDVTEIGDVDYRTAPNDGTNAGTAIIADAQGTEVNQAYLAYNVNDTTIKYGRQRILLDNQRFVGGVGFRQNEQTYDGMSVSNESLADTKIFAAYITNVNRIFGEANGIGDHKQATVLFNAKYSGLDAGAFSAYSYLIDNETAAAYSSDTYGLRFTGKTGGFGYSLEYATQSDGADSTLSYSADYLLAEGSYKAGPVTLKAGYELMGADGTDGQFMTPFATLHKFQGWADKFLGAPIKGSGNITGGIEDIYASATTVVSGVKLSLVYHQLGSDDTTASGMDDLGSEIGFVVAKKVGPVDLNLKYSDYSADDFATDTNKLWLTAALSF